MTAALPGPARGEIWYAALDPTRGHEQAGRRPTLIMSVTLFNSGPADLVVVLPLTTRARGVLWHVEVAPPDGGVQARSFIMCEAIRSIAKERLLQRWGSVAPATMALVEDRLRILLAL